MFYFLGKRTLLRVRHNMNIIKVSESDLSQTLELLCILQENPFLRFFSTTSNQQSFAVSYLVNKCGLSPESALLASKRHKFETSDKPDSVITFLKNHGFSETQIAKLVKKRPRLLSSNVEKTLSPKFEFFYSKGVSRSDLATLLSKDPTLLTVSIENQIIPYFNLLRSFLLSDENVFKTMKRFPRGCCYNINGFIIPNINVLRISGVPLCNIVKALNFQPTTFFLPAVMFKENVEKVKELGFNPENVGYVTAVYVLGSLSKSSFKKKLNAFKKYGWSEEDIVVAFRGSPQMMKTSEDKIKAIMDFLVNKMGFNASVIAKRPRILTFSLEKRLVPRGLFAQDLFSKGLPENGFLENGFQLSKLFESSEKVFLDKFVFCYEEKAPELLKLYEEKVNLYAGGKGKIQKS